MCSLLLIFFSFSFVLFVFFVAKLCPDVRSHKGLGAAVSRTNGKKMWGKKMIDADVLTAKIFLPYIFLPFFPSRVTAKSVNDFRWNLLRPRFLSARTRVIRGPSFNVPKNPSRPATGLTARTGRMYSRLRRVRRVSRRF